MTARVSFAGQLSKVQYGFAAVMMVKLQVLFNFEVVFFSY